MSPDALPTRPAAPGLADFNRAVSDWSSQFAPELQRVAKIIGNRMGWDHREFTISWSSLQRHYEAAYGETTSLPTLKKHARLWADHGGLKIVPTFRETNGRQLKKRDPGRRGKDGKRVGTRGGHRMNTDSNRFVVDFDVVVKGRKVATGERGRPAAEYWSAPWTFGQGISLPPSCPSVAGQLPRTTSNSVSTYVPTTSSATPGGKGEASPKEVEVSPGARTPRPPAQPTQGVRNTVTFWRDAKGRGRIFTHDKPRPRRAPASARTVTLTEEESAFMWATWPKGFPAEQIQFLQMTPAWRAARIKDGDEATDWKEKNEAAKRAASADQDGRVLREMYTMKLIALGVAQDEIDKMTVDEMKACYQQISQEADRKARTLDGLSPDEKKGRVLGYVREKGQSGLGIASIAGYFMLDLLDSDHSQAVQEIRAIMDGLVADGLIQKSVTGGTYRPVPVGP